MQTLKEINANDIECDSLKVRFKTLMTINHFQKFNLRTYAKIDENNKKIRNIGKSIVGIYKQKEVILQNVSPPKKGIVKVLDFAYKYIIIPSVLFSVGFVTAKLTK